MQSKALTRPATDITDEQCQLYTAAGLRVRRELTAGQVRKLVSTGRGWVSDWTGKFPAKKDFYHGGPLCEGYRVTRRIAHAWCWMKEAATKSWRRDLNLQVSSLFSGLANKDDYFYPRGTLHWEGAGRSWAMNNTPNVSGVE